jgi:L-ascorbate metabolism protein UlaG (beta-lactamase superfamily)
VDGQGQHLFLGFLLELAGATVYHSGDCVPYPDLAGHLRRREVDLALLPVNGRDPRRLSGGVPGNFTLDEAMELAGAASLRAVVGHHFGLFDFNTIDPEAARARIADHPELPPFLLSELSVRYDLRAPARRTVEGRGTIAP